ncbi:hypothetical protein [Streptomyces sp. NPDC093094]|uniref:hypothetical protein n=1 Tax=Streptomyces sp. NPDC093094 TaxID=3366026 RepID=UPI0038306530
MTAHDDDRTPANGPADDEYSATVLASHWIQRPDRQDTVEETVQDTDRQDTLKVTDTATDTVRATDTVVDPPSPDRVEGTVLRFGPGVTAAVAERTLRQPAPAVPSAAPPRRRLLRRHALPAVVLLCVLAFLAWQRLGPSVQVRSVTVAAGPAVLGCDTTAEIVARLVTDGRPGTITYRWIRSDGTSSGVLRERVARGQREARVRLRWTFEGEGRLVGRADLRILTPDPRTVTARLTYDCAGV